VLRLTFVLEELLDGELPLDELLLDGICFMNPQVKSMVRSMSAVKSMVRSMSAVKSMVRSMAAVKSIG